MLGGAKVYSATISNRYFHRLYLTRIDSEFDCDSFFPSGIELEGNEFRLLGAEEVQDDRVPQGTQCDQITGIHYQVSVYERNTTEVT